MDHCSHSYNDCFLQRCVYSSTRMCIQFIQESVMACNYVKEKGLAPVFLDSRLEHPAGWICVRYKSSVLLLLLNDDIATLPINQQ